MNSNNVNEQKRQEDREAADAEYITQHLNGNYAQQDISIGDTHLNRYSAPATLTAQNQPYVDYKYVSRRVHVWDGKTEQAAKFFSTLEEAAAAQGLLPFMMGLVSIIIPFTVENRQLGRPLEPGRREEGPRTSLTGTGADARAPPNPPTKNPSSGSGSPRA